MITGNKNFTLSQINVPDDAEWGKEGDGQHFEKWVKYLKFKNYEENNMQYKVMVNEVFSSENTPQTKETMIMILRSGINSWNIIPKIIVNIKLNFEAQHMLLSHDIYSNVFSIDFDIITFNVKISIFREKKKKKKSVTLKKIVEDF